MNQNAAFYTQERTSLHPWAQPRSGWMEQPAAAGFASLAQCFSPISLKQMDRVALLNRTDVKFVMPASQLLAALSTLHPDFWMLSVGGNRLNHYRTLYFDTPGFDLYNLHVNGRADRYKVRSRAYTDTSLSFLEVKHHTPKERTIKERIPTGCQVTYLSGEALDWVSGVLPFDGLSLEPKLWNTFTRLTLVSKRLCERVTLDIGLSFFNSEKTFLLNGIAVAEIKMDALCGDSPFTARMRELHIHPSGFSKYCIGVASLYSGVKKNSLKQKLLWINKMSGGLYLS